MTVELIGVVALLLGIVGLFLPAAFLVYVFLISTLLGAAAATVLTSLGGTNISPAHLLLGFLTVRLLSEPSVRHQALRGILFGRPGFWLVLTGLYCVISAYFLPRIFVGETFTYTVRSQTGSLVRLEPAMTNFTQSVYFVADCLCFVMIYGYAHSISTRRVLGRAIVACAFLNLVFAALDLVTYFTNTTELFSFIRNANYALLNDTEVDGFKRIVGSFVEASSFGAVTLGYFAFTGKLWFLGVNPRLTSALTVLAFCALMFSTSTTAYVGLLAVLLFAYVEIVLRAAKKPLTAAMTFFLIGGPFLTVLLVIMVALNDDGSRYLSNLMDTMVLNKMATASGIERSAWNNQALQNFYDTFGFGVGNGSVRASSFPIAVLASFGIVGTWLFAMFFFTVIFGRAQGQDAVDVAYQRAAKSACVANLITATISGALVDLGMLFFAFAAISCAHAVQGGKDASVRLL